MAVEWTSNLSVGVKAIDDQHKVWFQRANELFEAGRAGKTKDQIAKTLRFLDEYTKKHFSDEERYMQSISYPQLEAQKRLMLRSSRSLPN